MTHSCRNFSWRSRARSFSASPPLAESAADGATRRSFLEPLRNRRRRKSLADEANHLRAPALGDGDKPSELEPNEFDRARDTHGAEAEVREEVARKDRLVHLEALVLGLTLRIPVGKRLEGLRALVARFADRRQEERLQHPGTRSIEEVRTRDQDAVLRGRPRRQLEGPRKKIRRPVLHRADHPAVVVVVDRAPGTEVVLGSVDPAILVGPAPRLRLPPDAAVADDRRFLQRQPGQSLDPRRHAGGPTESTTTFTAAGRAPAIRSRYSSTRRCTSRPTSGIEVPQSRSRYRSMTTARPSPVTRTPRWRYNWLATSPRTPTVSRAASAA